jgi:hypothetical protein
VRDRDYYIFNLEKRLRAEILACYDFDYAVRCLHQSIDFAEIEHDFVPLRKWVNEVERSGHELEEMDNRLNHSVGQDLLQATSQTVVNGAISPSEALLGIRRWLNSGQSAGR